MANTNWWDVLSGSAAADAVTAEQQQQAAFEQQYLAQQAAQNSPEALKARLKTYAVYLAIAVVAIIIIKKVFF